MASSLNLGGFLSSELQTLSTEARRKFPDIKEAAERVIVILRGIKSTSTTVSTAAELRQHPEVVRPFILACRHSSASGSSSSSTRMTTTALQSLQQLVSARAVCDRSIGEVLRELRQMAGLGADVQVKVLQMVLPLVTLYADCVVGEELVEALHVCLALQQSRDAIVANTAAAILRQAVEQVFARVAQDDLLDAAEPDAANMDAEPHVKRVAELHASDALFILQDLCLLAADHEPVFLQAAGGADKRLVLELLESVLANHAAAVARHPAMALVLRERLAPFIVGFFADRAPFTLAVRSIRIVWLFVCHLHGAMAAECEVFLGILARLLAAESPLPPFYRVLALETVRKAAEDHALLRALFAQYDGNAQADDCHVIRDLVAAAARVVADGIPPEPAAAAGDALPVSAACGVRTQMHKLLDKAEPPAVPAAYLFAQALASIAALADALAEATGGQALALATQAWPALLPAIAAALGVRLDDEMFARALGSAQTLVCVWGAVGLREPRDQMLRLLCQLARPAAAAAPGGVPSPERRVLCLRAVLECACRLAAELQDAWAPVLGALLDTEDAAAAVAASEPVRQAAARMLAAARNAGPPAYLCVLRALVRLGSDAAGVPVSEAVAAALPPLSPLAAAADAPAQADRPVPAIERLRAFVVASDAVLMDSAAWDIVTQHLLAAALCGDAAAHVRAQASGALADIVLAAMDLAGATKGSSAADTGSRASPEAAQLRILTPLAQLMGAHVAGFAAGHRFAGTAEVRRVALDTLHRLLQASGHAVVRAWDVVFDIVQAVFAQPGALVASVFPCVQLVCSDYLADLPPRCLRRCIAVLAQFGRQRDDLNVALAAVGQAWALCDFLQSESMRTAAGARAGDAAEPPELTSRRLAGAPDQDAALEAIVQAWWAEDLPSGGGGSMRTRQVLWVLLLQALAALGRDARHEVRLGAIQTLFRTLDAHAACLDAWLWDATVWAVVLPLAQYAVAERARVFGLVRSGNIDELLGEASAGSLRVAERSGVCLEDPRRLLRKQWDETAATAMMGAARTWADHAAVWAVGGAEHAWRHLWALVGLFLVGASGSSDGGSAAVADWAALRSRDSVSAAVDCASVLAGCAYAGAVVDRVRTPWDAWLRMTRRLTDVPVDAGADINCALDSGGSVVVSQETLCALLRLCPALLAPLREAGALQLADCHALLALLRRLLFFPDAPLLSPPSDAAGMTRLQALALDTVALVQRSQPALALAELAMLAVAPYAIHARRAQAAPGGRGRRASASGCEGDSGDAPGVSADLLEHAVVGRAAAAFAGALARSEHLLALRIEGQRKPSGAVPAPTLVALGVAALDRLGDALRTGDGAELLLLLPQLLLDGSWLDAITAMGLHLVHPLHRAAPSDPAGQPKPATKASASITASAFTSSATATDWFVQDMPPAMLLLRAAQRDEPSKESAQKMRRGLSQAWAATGTVLALTLGMPLGDASLASDTPPVALQAQILMLDAVVNAGLRYVADDLPGTPAPVEVALYWDLLVRVLEWGAQMASEPAVLSCADTSDADCRQQGLTVACFRWLFRMSVDQQQPTMPLWVATAAAPTLVNQCRAVFQRFVADRLVLGKSSPMPVSHVELLCLVLNDLALLDCYPAALAWAKQDCGCENSSSVVTAFVGQATAGKSAHIFALYDDLLDLIPLVGGSPALIVPVQKCLRRMSPKTFG
ncbi:Endocytosis and vacuole integrity protein [Kickxella alabastrina]|uniref:Endocytosis and vacuole integrity protein n=1 Tax=Kickxella alabastrina TaxID=61397 RepID=A0ACC1IVP5_9FUNG|nr:Endocytosis and vacuole integrity protein [Kickxella alabastrina]